MFDISITDPGGAFLYSDSVRRECIAGETLHFDVRATGAPDLALAHKPPASSASVTLDALGRPSLQTDAPGAYRVEVRVGAAKRTINLVCWPSAAMASPLFRSPSQATGIQSPRMYLRALGNNPRVTPASIAAALEAPAGPARGTGLMDVLFGGDPQSAGTIAQYQIH